MRFDVEGNARNRPVLSEKLNDVQPRRIEEFPTRTDEAKLELGVAPLSHGRIPSGRKLGPT